MGTTQSAHTSQLHCLLCCGATGVYANPASIQSPDDATRRLVELQTVTLMAEVVLQAAAALRVGLAAVVLTAKARIVAKVAAEINGAGGVSGKCDGGGAARKTVAVLH